MISLTLSTLVQLSLLATPGAQTYDQAYKSASETGKPLVVLVGADWCPGCVTMKQSVMPQLAQNGELSKVSFATVNMDEQGALANQLISGGKIPQLLVYYKTPEGWKRQTFIGPQSPSTVISALQNATRASESTTPITGE